MKKILGLSTLALAGVLAFTGCSCGKDGGMTEEEAKGLIVRGFAEPIAKAFPVEYAVEMNRLIDLELEGTIG